ncbi:soluble calcium-activated nucleotidase 1-like [Sipha flava]|uniref:Apyrase n=2 Tax=Sipha flava TaxID=143950 RepID=A0A8B8G9H4_9HEMI|nr:soluble calcium-activated nucleotidase 1-like [Sipha flava]
MNTENSYVALNLHDIKNADYSSSMLKELRQSLSSSQAYRISNSTIRFQTHFVILVSLIGILFLVILYNMAYTPTPKLVSYGLNHPHDQLMYKSVTSKYPLSQPIYLKNLGVKFRIAIISDLDKASKSLTEKNIWYSYYKKGYLTWYASNNTIDILWDHVGPKVLKSSISMGGRGMELSELVTFNDKIYSFDDRTGIVYSIGEDDTVLPWIILMDGNGTSFKGYKSEWATVHNSDLYVGSMGKEWTSSTGEYVNNNPMWIKIINKFGHITHVNWVNNYIAIRKAANINFPGYMIHESCVWSQVHKRWFFLPRRSSSKQYNEDADEYMATNLLISASDNFKDIKVVHVGEIIPTHGYSSFKFLPGTNDRIIVALKSEEVGSETASYITAFNIDGTIILPEIKVANHKYEGIEFV